MARAFEAGDALVNRMADLWECYVVGPSGLQFFPASSNEEWNSRALTQWNAWKPFADIASRDGWDVLQGRIARSWFIDGEVFIVLTREGAYPRVNLVEAHLCRTPEGKEDAKNIIDGVEIDANGRPIAYWIQTSENKMTRFDASFVVHVFEPNRVGQYRGIPLVSPVMNDLRDLSDLQLLEMKASKAAGRVAIVQKNKQGELNSADFSRTRFDRKNTSNSGATVTQNRQDYYRETLGGDTVVLQSNDELAQFLNNRPTENMRALWRNISEKVCIGTGFVYAVVVPDSQQGTVYRASLDMMNAFFKARSSVLSGHFQRVYEWVIGTDPSLIKGRPNDWRNTSVRFPRAVNVDVGRNSQAAINELAAGLRTYQSLYGEVGADWKKEIEQKAIEAKFIQEMAAKHGVEASAIAASTLPTADQPQPQDATQ